MPAQKRYSGIRRLNVSHGLPRWTTLALALEPCSSYRDAHCVMAHDQSSTSPMAVWRSPVCACVGQVEQHSAANACSTDKGLPVTSAPQALYQPACENDGVLNAGNWPSSSSFVSSLLECRAETHDSATRHPTPIQQLPQHCTFARPCSFWIFPLTAWRLSLLRLD